MSSDALPGKDINKLGKIKLFLDDQACRVLVEILIHLMHTHN